MIVIGLTGGIASGKSTVSNILREIKIPVIDADIVSRKIIHEKSIIDKIVKNLGSKLLNGSGEIERKALAGEVFNNNNKLDILNSIMHPEIKKRILQDIENFKVSGEKLCTVDAALLIEADFISIVNYIIIVYISNEMQRERLIKRDNLTNFEADRRINSQMKFDDKAKYADFIIDNSGDKDETRRQVIKIIKKIESLEGIND